MGIFEEDNEGGQKTYGAFREEELEESGSERSALYLTVAYAVCAFLLFEGLFIVLWEHPSSLGLTGPFSKSEGVFLYIVAWGDIIAAFLCTIAIWFGTAFNSQNVMPIGWRDTRSGRMHKGVAKLGAGTLLLWRILVCLSIAPWAGIMLAFSPPTADKVSMYVMVCAYLILSIFLVYILTLAYRQIVFDSIRFQEYLDKQALGERKRLLRNAHRDNHYADCNDGGRDCEVEPVLFTLVDLAPTITLYTLVIATACVWSFFHLVISGNTAGGWAFFASTPEVRTTFWWEVFLYPICFFFALFGLAGSATLSSTTAPVLEEHQCRSSVLLFFLSSVFRFGLLFAITGMDLLEKNTCGFYLHGVAGFAYSSPWSPTGGILLHCVSSEWGLLAAVLVFCLLDAYLIWGTYKLYHHSHAWKLGKRSKNAIEYGAAPHWDDGYEAS